MLEGIVESQGAVHVDWHCHRILAIGSGAVVVLTHYELPGAVFTRELPGTVLMRDLPSSVFTRCELPGVVHIRELPSAVSAVLTRCELRPGDRVDWTNLSSALLTECASAHGL